MTFQPGHQKWGGKVKGTPNKATLERQQALQQALAACENLPEDVANMTPLGLLLTAMRHAWAKGSYGVAIKVAEIALPYTSPRLALADLRVTDDTSRKSDEELASELAELRTKAAAATVRH